MLVTLDPVGEGFWVSLGSDIYAAMPNPVAKVWINVRAKPKTPDQSDTIAEFGERLTVTAGDKPTLNYVADVNHYDSTKMFRAPLKDNKSAADSMNELIRKYTQ